MKLIYKFIIYLIIMGCMLITTGVFSHLFAKTTNAMCWSEYFNEQPCKVKKDSYDVWLLTQGWVKDKYFQSDRFMVDDMEYILLLELKRTRDDSK